MALRFMTFEGPEGAGKSTQIALLSRALANRGLDVVTTREPGGTAIGERLRALLLVADQTPVAATTEALLHTAARAQHVEDVIRPGLQAGKTVLCDRFVDSTLAYQGGGRGLPLDELRAIQRLATGGIEPDLRILLDLPVEEGLRRRRMGPESWNRMDEESISFHRRVRAMYHRLVTENPTDWFVVDASGAIEQVAQAIELAVERRMALGAGAIVSGAVS